MRKRPPNSNRIASSTPSAGFSLIELSIVMLLFTMITGILVLFYAQTRLILERGMSKTELQQRTRYASIRIIPKITSVVIKPPPSDPTDPHFPNGLPPLPPLADYIPGYVPPPVGYNPASDAGYDTIHLQTTKEFIKDQLRLPVNAGDEFNPRGNPSAQFGILTLRFVVTSTDPELGDIGEVRMNALPPDNIAEDIVLARNLNLVSFLVYPDNRRVRLRIRTRGYIKNATSGRSVDESVYETDVYLPVYTNSSGGG